MAPKRRKKAAPGQPGRCVEVRSLEEVFDKVHLRPEGNFRKILVRSLYPRHAAGIFAIVELTKPRWEVYNAGPLKNMAAAEGTMSALRLGLLPSLLVPPVHPSTLDLIHRFVGKLRSEAYDAGGNFLTAANLVTEDIRDFLRQRRAHPGPEDEAYRVRVGTLMDSMVALQDGEYTIAVNK